MKLRRICINLPIYSTGCIILALASSSTWSELDLHREQLKNEANTLEAQASPNRRNLRTPAVPLMPSSQELEVILTPNDRTILYNQNSTPLLSSQVSLPVKKIYFRMGEHFMAGDVLLEIEDTIFRVNLLKAKATYERAQAIIQSRERLYSDHISSFLELKEAQATLATAEAELVLAQQQLMQTKIRAPYDGKVVQLLIQEHELPQPGQALVEIVNDKILIAKLLAPSIYLNQIKIGKYLRIHVKETDTEVYAKIIRIGAVIDPASGTIAVDAEIDNSDERFVAGMIGSTTISSIVDEPPKESHIGPNENQTNIQTPPLPPETHDNQKMEEDKNREEGKSKTFTEIHTSNQDETINQKVEPANERKKSLYFFKHVYDILFNPLINQVETTNEKPATKENVEAKGQQEPKKETLPENENVEVKENTPEPHKEILPENENVEVKENIPEPHKEILPENENVEVKGNIQHEPNNEIPAANQNVETKTEIAPAQENNNINENIETRLENETPSTPEIVPENREYNVQPELHDESQVVYEETHETIHEFPMTESYVIYEEDLAPCEQPRRLSLFESLYEKLFNQFYFTTFGTQEDVSDDSLAENETVENTEQVLPPKEYYQGNEFDRVHEQNVPSKEGHQYYDGNRYNESYQHNGNTEHNGNYQHSQYVEENVYYVPSQETHNNHNPVSERGYYTPSQDGYHTEEVRYYENPQEGHFSN